METVTWLGALVRVMSELTDHARLVLAAFLFAAAAVREAWAALR